MANKLRITRERAGITQKELAAKVGVDQIQIQRIESNKCAAPIDLAVALSEALASRLNDVFPGAAKVLEALKNRASERKFSDREAYEKLRKVGLEGDSRRHSLKVLLRGHEKAMFFDVPAHEVERLFGSVQHESIDADETSFIVFDSNDLRVAINLRELVFCHFLWEPGFLIVTRDAEVESDDDGPTQTARVYFTGAHSPISIGAEMEQSDDIEDEGNYFNRIFVQLDAGFVQEYERLHIVDSDGESAFLRGADVALLTVPLWVVDPDERLPYDEVDDEGE